jgi:hypothetical protein
VRRVAPIAGLLLAAVAVPLLLAAPAQAGPDGAVHRSVTVQHRRITVVGATDADLAVTTAAVLDRAAAPSALATANPCNGLRELCLFENSTSDHRWPGDTLVINVPALRLPGPLDLADFGFDNMMSSWGNDSGVKACWWAGHKASARGHLMRSLGNQVQDLFPAENDTASIVDTANKHCR